MHHPLVGKMVPWSGYVNAGFVVNFLGAKTRCDFFGEASKAQAKGGFVKSRLPLFDEEYLEYTDLIETIMTARDRFVMIELGAGYGRWLVNAACALRTLNPLPFYFVGVEAEPTHFAWMQMHLKDNGIDSTRCRLIQAAVNHTGEPIRFCIGDPTTWYGQTIDPRCMPGSFSSRLRSWAKFLIRGHWDFETRDGARKMVTVKGITLNQILESLDSVDLIDLDIQGAEYLVLSHSIFRLNKHVKRLHIGTHSRDIEENLRALFRAHRWECLHDYPRMTDNATPYGTIRFEDGIQTWINPRLN